MKRVLPMKLLIILLWCSVGGGQLVAHTGSPGIGSGYSHLTPDKMSLRRMVKKLEEKYSVSFMYKSELSEFMILNTDDSFSSLEKELEHLLKPCGLRFEKVAEDFYVIYTRNDRKKEVLRTSGYLPDKPLGDIKSTQVLANLNREPSLSKEQQQKNLTGQVTSEEGETLPGVNVVVKGTNLGTVTDFEGRFRLNAPDDATVLIFSYIGYKTQEVAIGNQSVINVTMAADVQTLSEVVVNALGIEQNKDELGSTYSTVQTSDINRSGEALILNSLAAKASNVQITSSNGDPGAGTNIRIRGANTISGASDPLIILDGIPISNSTIYGGGNDISGGRDAGTSQQSRLNDLNPNDIESVQILKGASAASLWGSRAANGVIVITTKSGEAGKMKVSYKVTRSFDEVLERIPMQTTFGQGRSGSYNPTRAESWGDYIPNRSGAPDEVDITGEFFEAADGTRYYPILSKNQDDIFVESNWDQVFQTGGFWQHDLTLSGGNDKATYFFSAGRLDQEGIIKNSDYDRTNLRLNSKFYLNDIISASARAGYTKSNSNRIQQSSNVNGLLLGLLRTPPDFDNSDYIGTYTNDDGVVFPLRHRSYRKYLGGTTDDANPTYNNPNWTVFEQEASSEVDRFIMATELDITPISWLSFTLRGGIDKSTDKRVYFFPVGSASDTNSGTLAEDVISEQEINFDAIGKANFNLTPDISLQATLGWNINDRRRFINSSELNGFLPNSRLRTTNLNTATANSNIENTARFIRSNRGYAVLSFDLLDQLFVNMSGAVEAASSVSGTFFYPSIDAAWQFTDNLDLSSTPISFGKLRASWGKVGVQPLPHRFKTLSESGFFYTTYSDPLEVARFGGGFRVDDDKGNPDLEPEIKTEFEVGMDLRFFDDKLSFTASYYQNEITGILIEVGLTPSSGFDTQYANAASMENKGLEMEIDYTILNNQDWEVGVFGNWARNRNEVTSLSGTDNINLTPGASVSSRAVVGEPLGVLFGTGSRVNEEGGLDLDANGFPQTTSSPVVLGDPNPDWRSGFGLRGAWKNLALNVLFEHVQGGAFSPRTLWVLRRFGTTQETANVIESTPMELVNYRGEVIPAGSFVRGNIANFGGGDVLLDERWYRTGIGGGFGDNQAYNFSIKDATQTRLRELSLGYTINSDAFRSATKLGSVTFTATARNLFVWDDLEGIDPQQTNQFGVSNGQGLDYFTNPATKSYIFSVLFTL